MGDEEATEGGGGDATTSDAASFDDFSSYFVRLVVVVIWMVYLMPIIMKFINTKHSKWQKGPRWGWQFFKGKKSIDKIQ